MLLRGLRSKCLGRDQLYDILRPKGSSPKPRAACLVSGDVGGLRTKGKAVPGGSRAKVGLHGMRSAPHPTIEVGCMPQSTLYKTRFHLCVKLGVSLQEAIRSDLPPAPEDVAKEEQGLGIQSKRDERAPRKMGPGIAVWHCADTPCLVPGRGIVGDSKGRTVGAICSKFAFQAKL